MNGTEQQLREWEHIEVYSRAQKDLCSTILSILSLSAESKRWLTDERDRRQHDIEEAERHVEALRAS